MPRFDLLSDLHGGHFVFLTGVVQMPPTVTATSDKHDPLLGNPQYHGRSCAAALLCGPRLVATSAVGHQAHVPSLGNQRRVGEGGMLCCHGVSLEVKVQKEGLDRATWGWDTAPFLLLMGWSRSCRGWWGQRCCIPFPPPPRCLILPSQPVLQEAGIVREHWARATTGGQSGRQGIRGQLWAWQGTREGQAGEAQLDGEGCSAGSCVPRAGYGGPRGDRCGSLGPSAGSSPCQRTAREHRWRRNWVPRGCGRSSPTDRAHFYAPTHVARDARPPPTTAHLQASPPSPDLGRGSRSLGVRAWMLDEGSESLLPPVFAFHLAHSCVTAKPPSFPGNPWGISRASKRRVTWRKGLLSNPPPTPPPSTANPKLVPGLQPD